MDLLLKQEKVRKQRPWHCLFPSGNFWNPRFNSFSFHSLEAILIAGSTKKETRIVFLKICKWQSATLLKNNSFQMCCVSWQRKIASFVKAQSVRLICMALNFVPTYLKVLSRMKCDMTFTYWRTFWHCHSLNVPSVKEVGSLDPQFESAMSSENKNMQIPSRKLLEIASLQKNKGIRRILIENSLTCLWNPQLGVGNVSAVRMTNHFICLNCLINLKHWWIKSF